jgi:23S rRNA pseudouridine1911/1915/1917 synthase
VSSIVEVIPAALAGQRIDRVVSLITGESRAEAAEIVAGGGVRVNGDVVAAKAQRLQEHDEIEVSWHPADAVPPPQPDPGISFTVVHVDDDVVVIDKPAGLVVHPGAGHGGDTLVNGLLARYPEIATVGQVDRPGIVHRLDKETSGLLMVARSQAAYEGLVEQLSARSVDRRYVALVWGVFATPQGQVEAPIGRSSRDPTRMSVTERGKEAITRYDVQQVFTEPAPVSLVECKLETGRTHQIRVHLQAIGHAVVGDTRYHGVRQTLPVPRLFLHAAHLGFRHPLTDEHLTFDAALPDDLRAVLDTLA